MAVSDQTLSGTKSGVPTNATALAPIYRNGRVRICEDYLTTVKEAQIGSTIKLGWFPKGAWIIGGTVAGSALGTGVETTVGVIGKSGTTYDDDANAFNATATALTSSNIDVGDAVSRVAQTIPYQVTDPDGAHVILTLENTNTAASNQVVTASIQWVQD